MIRRHLRLTYLLPEKKPSMDSLNRYGTRLFPTLPCRFITMSLQRIAQSEARNSAVIRNVVFLITTTRYPLLSRIRAMEQILGCFIVFVPNMILATSFQAYRLLHFTLNKMNRRFEDSIMLRHLSG